MRGLVEGAVDVGEDGAAEHWIAERERGGREEMLWEVCWRVISMLMT